MRSRLHTSPASNSGTSRAGARRLVASCLAVVGTLSWLVPITGAHAAGPTATAGALVGAEASAIEAAPQLLAPATVAVDLCAKEGTLDLPGTSSVPIWGFALSGGDPCGSAAVEAQLPGPTVEATVGDTVEVTLHNELTERLSIAFPGQTEPFDTKGVVSGGSKTYSFVAGRPGTFLYEAGTKPGMMLPMGLYGGLIVRPGTAGQAYDDPATAYDHEELLILSEIDPELNAHPKSFIVSHYRPRYWLINGRPYPDAPSISTTPGETVLLRYANAGVLNHTMRTLGIYQRLLARDSYPSFAIDVIAETFAAGSTGDALVEIPAGASPGDSFPLYSRQLQLTNADDYPGGMLTFLEVT